MSSPTIQANDCCAPCQNPTIENVPGPRGTNGTNGNDGIAGVNAFTTTAASFVQPASSGNVSVQVVNSTWIVPGEAIFIQNGGIYSVVSVPDPTHVLVTNLGYTQNAAPTTVIPSTSGVTPSGFNGATGAGGGGDMLKANNLSDVANIATSRSNLGLGALAVLSSVNNANWVGTALAIGNGGTGQVTAGAALTALGAQAVNALLTSLAAQGASANQMYYTSGVNTIAVIATTAFGRSALTDVTAAGARSRLGLLLPQYGLLGSAVGMDLNTGATDTAIQIEATRYRIDKITFENASANTTTATAGVFTAAGGGGTTLAADQGLTALSAASKFKDITLQGVVATDTRTEGTLYARCGTPQGAPDTCSVWIFGWKYA